MTSKHILRAAPAGGRRASVAGLFAVSADATMLDRGSPRASAETVLDLLEDGAT